MSLTNREIKGSLRDERPEELSYEKREMAQEREEEGIYTGGGENKRVSQVSKCYSFIMFSSSL